MPSIASYRHKVLVGTVMVRLEAIHKMIAGNHGFQLLTARVHDVDHMHMFVSAPPKASVSDVVRVFKCVSAQLLFKEYPEIKE